MKKSLKILTVLLIAVLLVSISTSVFAAALTPGDLESAMDSSLQTQDASALQSTAGNVMAIIRNISIIAAVIVLMVIGVKFMLGSTEEKAEYKKSLMPLVIGVILVVAATSIATFLFEMLG